MIIKFDCRGNDKQFEASKHWIDNSIIDIVYGGSKGSGKSCLGTSLICGDALIYPGTPFLLFGFFGSMFNRALKFWKFQRESIVFLNLNFLSPHI